MASSRALQPTAGRRAGFSSTAIAILVFLATAILFGRACGNQFVNYDDNDYVTANEQVQAGVSVDGVRWALTAKVASNWHPLTWMSHMADVSLFGRNPRGHHATSVLLHALNAAFLFVVLRRVTGAVGASAVCAILFALHPLRVESVAWVAERKDVLSGFFFVLTLLAYTAYVERRRTGESGVRWYVVTAVAFVLGLMAKPMLVTLPFLLLVLDYWPLGRNFGGVSFRDVGEVPSPRGLEATRSERTIVAPSARSRTTFAQLIVEKLPLFALAVASAGVTYRVQQQSGAVTAALSLGARLANAIVGVPRYLGKIFWPSNLAVLYPHPGQWSLAIVVSALLLIGAVTWFVWLQRRERPWLLVGWLWFVGVLVPVSGVVQVGLQSIADRYTYLPSIGIDLAIVWTGREILGVLAPRVAVGSIGAALAALTITQLGFWRNSLTLFNHTIAVAGDGNYLAYDNRGVALGDAGRADAATADYERALAIAPDYPNANNNLARILAERGQTREAIARYRVALRAKPENLEIRNNLANALSDAGEIGEAMEHYRFVLQRAPKHLNARNGYAVALASTGKLEEAERELREVLKADPDNVSAMSNLGNICAMSGRREEAAALYRRSLEAHPDDARTLYNLANLLVELGKNDAAAENYRRAVKLAPVNPDAHAMLGMVLLRLGRRTEAIDELQLALQQRPNFPQAQAWLAAARGAAR